MIRISGLRLQPDHEPWALKRKAARILGLDAGELAGLTVERRSVDARKKPQVFLNYTVLVSLKDQRLEERLLKRVRDKNVTSFRPQVYRPPHPGEGKLSGPPVIIGAGPAGLFAGLLLARFGYRPFLFEQGEDVDHRSRTVEAFWSGAELDAVSNVQFGEGGAGTFSDGKLNTQVSDPSGRGREVLSTLVRFGAGAEILYEGRPHVGTDVLGRVVKGIREEILALGGQPFFKSQVTDFVIGDGVLKGVVINGEREVPANAVILACGHSARATFSRLSSLNVPMEPKAFAVGVRVQHPQRLINLSQYGAYEVPGLGAANYKLTHRTREGRGVYSFCMCPGGYVVNASSEPGLLAINGMSYHDRAGENANSAVVVTVSASDFASYSPGAPDVLAGLAFQRMLERQAFAAADGLIPVQLFGDFKTGRESRGYGSFPGAFKGKAGFGRVDRTLPEAVYFGILSGMEDFGKKLAGFDREDTVLASVESRTSSPVRILRDEHFESPVAGLFPCGEGAGYAGGITSAAMDGLKVAEELIKRYAPLEGESGR